MNPWTFAHLPPPPADSTPEWVAAWATVAAVLVAAISIGFAARANSHSRKAAEASIEANELTAKTFAADVKERSRAQARLVYATLHNVYAQTAGNIWIDDGATRRGASGDFTNEVVDTHGNRIRVAEASATTAVIDIHNRSDELIGPVRLSLIDRETGQPVGGITVGDDLPLAPGEVWRWALSFAPMPGTPLVAPDLTFRDADGRWWRRAGIEPLERLDRDPSQST